MNRRALPAVLLITVAVAAFARTTRHGFLFWDDRAFIAENRLIAHPSAANLIVLWTRPLLDLYAPLTYTLWALLSALFGPTPWVFHLTNVALHALNAWIVFALLRDLVEDDGAALGGALVFAVHPVQTEAVAWASGTKDLLSTLLSLIAIREYVRFRAEGRREHFVQASLAFTGALLAKPSAVVTPLLVLVLERTLWRRPWRYGIGAMLPWLGAAAAFTLIAARAQPAAEHLRSIPPLWLRPAVALDALGFYALKLVLPFHLAPDYGRTAERLWSTGELAWSWMPGAAALATAFLLRRRLPAMAAAVGLFTAALLPVLGLVPFDFQHYSNVADRYLYLAMLGPALGVACACRRLSAPVRAVAVASAVTALLAVSVRQAAVWKDDATVAARTLAVNPRSFMAHNNLGQLLEERGQLTESLSRYRAALDADPGDGNVLNNIGNVLYKEGRYDEAICHYRGILGPAHPRGGTAARMHNNLGAAYLKTGRYDDAAAEFRDAIGIDPEYLEPYYNLGLVLLASGRRDDAVRVLREGLAVDPEHPALRRQLGVAMGGAGAPPVPDVPRSP